jgi:hypothetical protein
VKLRPSLGATLDTFISPNLTESSEFRKTLALLRSLCIPKCMQNKSNRFLDVKFGIFDIEKLKNIIHCKNIEKKRVLHVKSLLVGLKERLSTTHIYPDNLLLIIERIYMLLGSIALQ